MIKTPELDLTRLQRLRAEWKSAMAASSAAQDDILQAAKTRNQFGFDIRQMEEDANQLRGNLDAREIRQRTAEMRASETAATERLKKMKLAAEPLAENAQRLGAIYRRAQLSQTRIDHDTLH